MHRYVKVADVVAQLHVDPEFLHSLEAENVIALKRTSEGDLVMSGDDAERVRVAVLLATELEVNIPGVEVIMHMRDTMHAMQQQFSEILDALVEELRRQLPQR